MVGVCSYLLVNFWFTRIAANQSSISAFLTNRVGDCFLAIGMFIIIWSFGNINYSIVFSLAPYINQDIITLIGICLLIGAMAKSSQIGLHVWLPQAMEGPTPVSALIHAATMVTAGVYLLMRSSPLIEYSSTVLILCLWVGAITTVFSSIIGLFQQDIKKVIAYSTMSLLALVYNYFLNTHIYQTKCEEIIFNNFNKIIFIVNSQITKAYAQNLFYIFFTILWYYWYIFKNIITSVRWKVYTLSKLVGISETIRLILIFFKFNLKPVFNLNNLINYSGLLPYQKKISLLRHYHHSAQNFSNNNDNFDKNLAYIQWLAGLIDGCGSFLLTKKGKTRFELTLRFKDKKILYVIKHRYGGSLKTVAAGKSIRYKLIDDKGLFSLLKDLNGHLRNPARILEFHRFSSVYKLEYKPAKPLTFDNGWLSGFIDSHGSISIKESEVYINILHINLYLLNPLIAIYGGEMGLASRKVEAFKYIVYKEAEWFNLIDNYFSKYPLKTAKRHKLRLVKKFFFLRLNSKRKDINNSNRWTKFQDIWDKCED